MTVSMGRSERRTRGRIEAEGKVRQDLRQSASRELSNVSEDDQVFRYRQLPFTVFRTFENTKPFEASWRRAIDWRVR